MIDRITLEFGEKENGDRVHIMCEAVDLDHVLTRMIDHNITPNFYNSYGLSKPARKELDRLRAIYE